MDWKGIRLRDFVNPMPKQVFDWPEPLKIGAPLKPEGANFLRHWQQLCKLMLFKHWLFHGIEDATWPLYFFGPDILLGLRFRPLGLGIIGTFLHLLVPVLDCLVVFLLVPLFFFNQGLWRRCYDVSFECDVVAILHYFNHLGSIIDQAGVIVVKPLTIISFERVLGNLRTTNQTFCETLLKISVLFGFHHIFYKKLIKLPL